MSTPSGHHHIALTFRSTLLIVMQSVTRAMGHQVRKVVHLESEEGEQEDEEEDESEGKTAVTYSKLRGLEEPSFVTGDSACKNISIEQKPYDDEPAVDTPN